MYKLKNSISYYIYIASAILAIIFLSYLSFADSLSCYVFADDYRLIHYAYNIWHGHFDLIFKPFFSKWLEYDNIILLYRPLIPFAQALAFPLVNYNIYALHWGNLILHMLISIIILLISIQIISKFLDRISSLIFSTFVALLFTTYPINAETVIWQCTSLCALFFFLSLALFIRAQNAKTLYLSIFSTISFLCALLAKEHAITLPAIAFIYCFLIDNQTLSIKANLSKSFKQTLPLWLVLIIYFIVRTVILGNPAASYVGSIGESLYSQFYDRWFSPFSWLKLAYPINADIFSPNDITIKFLQALHICSASIITIRVISGNWRQEINYALIFFICFYLLCLLPIYQVWYITDKLANSRQFYFASAPFFMMLVTFIFCPFQVKNKITKILSFVSSLILTAYIICFIHINFHNNIAWLEASDQIRSLKLAIEKATVNIAAGQKLVILNLPHEYKGIYLMGELRMLQDLLRPPLSNIDVAHKIDLLDAYNYSSQNLLNTSELKRKWQNHNRYKFTIWNYQFKRLDDFTIDNLELLQLPPIEINGPIYTSDKSNFLFKLNTNSNTTAPINLDFIEIELKAQNKLDNKPHLTISWFNENTNALSSIYPTPESNKYFGQKLICDNKLHKYMFPLSQYKSWALSKQIPVIKLFLPASIFDLEINTARFLQANALVPILNINMGNSKEESGGIYTSNNGNFLFNFDISKIKGATKAILEISKPNANFVTFSDGFRDKELSKQILRRISKDKTTGNILISKDMLPKQAEYTVHLAALSNTDQIIGYFSDPIVISNKNFNSQ